jgi:hypothetical protein
MMPVEKTVRNSGSWRAKLSAYQLQAAKFLTAQPSAGRRYRPHSPAFCGSRPLTGLTRDVQGGAFNPHGSARRPRNSLRTLRFLRLTGWPLLTALFSTVAKLKRFSNHRGKQQHTHVGQFGERVLDHRRTSRQFNPPSPHPSGRYGNRADVQPTHVSY